MMVEINPLIWFGKREVSPTPKHFIKAPTPLSPTSKLWVMTKIKGRYSISHYYNDNEENFLSLLPDTSKEYIFFEDPKEVMLYELRWAGSK